MNSINGLTVATIRHQDLFLSPTCLIHNPTRKQDHHQEISIGMSHRPTFTQVVRHRHRQTPTNTTTRPIHLLPMDTDLVLDHHRRLLIHMGMGSCQVVVLLVLILHHQVCITITSGMVAEGPVEVEVFIIEVAAIEATRDIITSH